MEIVEVDLDEVFDIASFPSDRAEQSAGLHRYLIVDTRNPVLCAIEHPRRLVRERIHWERRVEPGCYGNSRLGSSPFIAHLDI